MVHKLCFVFCKTCSMEMFGAASVSVSQLGLMEVSTEQTLRLQDVFFPMRDSFSFFGVWAAWLGKIHLAKEQRCLHCRGRCLN